MKQIFIIICALFAVAAYAENETVVTSKKYVDDELSKKQPQFEGLGNAKLMLYSDTTDGVVASRDIVTSLGTSTTDTSVPTVGAINAGLATKQDTLNGTAGWVVENTGTSGSVIQRPVYSETDNYKTALVEVEDLNQIVIDAVNSELTVVPGVGWQINQSVTLPTLRILLNANIAGTGYCYRRLNGNGGSDGTCSASTLATLGAINSKSGLWGAVFSYGDIVGKSVCSTIQGTTQTAATDAQESSLSTEFNAQTGAGTPADTNAKYCWCKMESVAGEPAVSRWVLQSDSYSSASDCAPNCAGACAYRVYAYTFVRSPMFNTVQ